MKTPEQIESLFERYPGLSGFSVRGIDELPDNYPRGEGFGLFVGDVGITPAPSRERLCELFEEIADALAELIDEEPGAGETLRGRTFARVLH